MSLWISWLCSRRPVAILRPHDRQRLPFVVGPGPTCPVASGSLKRCEACGLCFNPLALLKAILPRKAP